MACTVLSSLTIKVLLIMIAWGWTINFKEFDELDVYIPMMVLFAAIHIMVVGLS